MHATLCIVRFCLIINITKYMRDICYSAILTRFNSTRSTCSAIATVTQFPIRPLGSMSVDSLVISEIDERTFFQIATEHLIHRFFSFLLLLVILRSRDAKLDLLVLGFCMLGPSGDSLRYSPRDFCCEDVVMEQVGSKPEYASSAFGHSASTLHSTGGAS